MGSKEIGIAILGLGTVGSGVWDILQQKSRQLQEKTGCKLKVRRVLVNDLNKQRNILVPEELFTDDFEVIRQDDGISIVVEAMGGVNPAYEYITASLQAKKQVVTANKEVMAKHSQEISAAAKANGVHVFIEACVGGGIPIIQPLEECLAANDILSVAGIINGTTNYILTKMIQEKSSFGEVLREAQEFGYAESDPTADIEGYDALYKIALLAEKAFKKRVPLHSVYREGITHFREVDRCFAEEAGYAVKLIGTAIRKEDGLDVRVQPVFLPREHALASIHGVKNAVLVKGDAVGEVMFSGPGAGSLPTGSAVVADILRAVKQQDMSGLIDQKAIEDVQIVDSHRAPYYIRLTGESTAGLMVLYELLKEQQASVCRFESLQAEPGKRQCMAVTSPLSEKQKQRIVHDLKKERADAGTVYAVRIGI